ncbi:MAG: DUF1273 family protein [Clostridia bacterium]|nr:DUF1273 family protein [Clostridia bacterium]
MEKKHTCCFTGHREIDSSVIKPLKKSLKRVLQQLIKEGYLQFISGGALGFDLLAAETVLNLKQKHPHIHLTMALPCRNQDAFWNLEQKAKYNAILSLADDIIYTAEGYYNGCMFKRNRYMVDNASCVIAYLTHGSGGTKYTVDYAEKMSRNIIFVNHRPGCQLSFFA